MPSQLPIACSLNAAELPARLAEMAAVGRAALRGAQTSGRTATLRFEPGARTHARLRAIVAAEATCCAFLELSLRHERDALVLSITAPAGAEPVLDEIVAAFGDR